MLASVRFGASGPEVIDTGTTRKPASSRLPTSPTEVLVPTNVVEPAASGSSAPVRAATASQLRRSAWIGLDQASIMSVELLSAVLTWAAIGWLLDRWLGSGPWLLIVGVLVGNAAGVYLVWLRSSRMEGYAQLAEPRRSPEGVARAR